MKQIQPVSIWYNGSLINANVFNFYSINDNLSTSATFYYALFSGTLEDLGTQLANGNLTMEGFDYEAYSSSPDSNSYAYQWGATKLNLTII
jgi:hypothetical protein